MADLVRKNKKGKGKHYHNIVYNRTKVKKHHRIKVVCFY